MFLRRHKARDVESHLTTYVLRRSSLGRHGNKLGNQFSPMWSTYPDKMLAYQSRFHPSNEEGLAIADWNDFTLSIYTIRYFSCFFIFLLNCKAESKQPNKQERLLIPLLILIPRLLYLKHPKWIRLFNRE